MCGIIGYVGTRPAGPILLEGLRRLEYRGYDSAGVALISAEGLSTRKRKGRIQDGLANLLAESPIRGACGIGHTRWATHGPPSDENSHPHLDAASRIAVVHNGVIENFDRLKERFIGAGHRFLSATDTEVLAHLIGDHLQRLTAVPDGVHPLAQAVCNALREVIGTYGLAVVAPEFPGIIVGARRGSPLLVGVGEGENFLASDASAVVAHTRQVVYLNDYDVVTVEAGVSASPAWARRRHGCRSPDLSSMPKRRSGAPIRTSCSRRSSSSHRPCGMHCAGGSTSRRRRPNSAG